MTPLTNGDFVKKPAGFFYSKNAGKCVKPPFNQENYGVLPFTKNGKLLQKFHVILQESQKLREKRVPLSLFNSRTLDHSINLNNFLKEIEALQVLIELLFFAEKRQL